MYLLIYLLIYLICFMCLHVCVFSLNFFFQLVRTQTELQASHELTAALKTDMWQRYHNTLIFFLQFILCLLRIFVFVRLDV